MASVRAFSLTAAALLQTTTATATGLCPDLRPAPQFDPANHAECVRLWPEARNPSDAAGVPKPLNEYEAVVGRFFSLFCHRDPQLQDAQGQAWGHDPAVRDTGPYVAYRRPDGDGWDAEYHGYHSPVVIWYSPAMVRWLEVNRPLDGPPVADPPPVPDGVMLVKEMYTVPAARCASEDVDRLRPKNGIAYMVRARQASHDGWFWGYWGYPSPQADAGVPTAAAAGAKTAPAQNAPAARDANIDWPAPVAGRPINSPAYAGFGQYCVNCHASAVNNSTFSSLRNMTGDGVNFLSQTWFLEDAEARPPTHVPPPAPAAKALPDAGAVSSPDAAFSRWFHRPPGAPPIDTQAIRLPAMTYDNVWVGAGEEGKVPLASEYVTSDQCLGCHDAGSTGLAFDMTEPNPHGDDLINLSPYATWRTSPMGLAGRDPIFYGQVASEEVFHPDYVDLIWNTCFGCHGILGQRQFQLDRAASTEDCAETVFLPEYVTAIPYDDGARPPPADGPHFDAAHARYGALARDGISCVACHRTVITPEQTAAQRDAPQNKCILARQQQLNVDIGHLQGFARNFTGSFLASAPDELYGPFRNPKTRPMRNALGITPNYDPAIASSEQCGTCHVVHLPVLWPKAAGSDEIVVLDDTFEQTTYAEWAFSAFRTGDAPFLGNDAKLPHGAGQRAQSCAGCHMESHGPDGKPFRDKIASIQERTGMPEVENALAAVEIDLAPREGFARHTLVGLNQFLIRMAEQFPEVLGVPLQDPMLTGKGMAPLQRTAMKMEEAASNGVVRLTVDGVALGAEALTAEVHLESLVGHKFPSGVSFRRAFVEFEVLDAGGETLWRSGGTDAMGVIVDGDGRPVRGELWYDDQCRKTVGQSDYQPHYELITHPSQVQIYQEVKLDPGDPAVETSRPSCTDGAPVAASARPTTSFLSICHTPKDNRLLPPGLLPFKQRAEVARALGLAGDEEAAKLATETGATGVGDDPDYRAGGGDTVTYRVPLRQLDGTPAAVRATLHYQATPPFYLQDRFCNGEGANRDRLYHIASLLDLDGTRLADWKFRLVSSGAVPIRP
jgi:hypothetical protein